MSGWIKLHRSIEEHWIYQEKRVFSKYEAWIDMILNVNYSDNKILIKGKLYTIKRGESVKSLDTWATRWGWNKSQVRRFFKLLEDDSMIKLKSDSKTTQLTICNYESYQDVCNADETQTKRKRNANETLTTPIKERKEEKEYKEENKKPTFEERKKKFLDWFNLQIKKHKGKDGGFKTLSGTTESNFKRVLEINYSQSELERAFANMFNNDWAIKNNQINPTHFLRLDNLERYMNSDYNSNVYIPTQELN